MNAKNPATGAPRDYQDLPLVYSCSGCSNAAQLANTLAVRLDREGLAEMSCIAGVGGDVKSLVRKATSGRPVIVLDGCALHCAKNCLRRHGVAPTLHMDLSEHGVKKQYHEDVSLAETWRIWRGVVLPAVGELRATGSLSAMTVNQPLHREPTDAQRAVTVAGKDLGL